MPVLAHFPRHGRGASADDARYGAERIAPAQPLLDPLPFPERQLPVFFVHGSFLSAADGKVWRLCTIAGKSRFVKRAASSGRMALGNAGARALAASELSATVAFSLKGCICCCGEYGKLGAMKTWTLWLLAGKGGGDGF